MSADNWATCPRCAQARALTIANKAAEIDAAYGNVPVVEFDNMRAKLEEMKAERLEATFREDYEVGIEGVEFYVRYSGGCTECGLKHKFDHDDRLLVNEEAKRA